ncbi:MAG: DUF937 domain-containing protein [Methylotenera sp.]|nr:DUF937 domain-containing protein [Methylotenera sp.]
MGLLDSVAGAVLGNLGGDKGAMAQVAMDLLNQNGGLQGVLDKFNAGGLAEQAASWVSKGENLPVSADQIASVLGNGAIADIAAKLGLDSSDVSSKIAEYLPQLVDKMTPDGEVGANSGSLLSTVLGMLK